jgi:hypothetical protein
LAYTKEQKDKRGTCGAKKKNGDKCRNFAGLGTPHLGVGTCKFHLGNAPNQMKHAVKLQAEKEVAKARIEFGETIPVHPTEALLTTLQLSAGQMVWLQQQLEALDDGEEGKGSFEGQVLLRMWGDERDRVARISEAALRAGVQERVVRLAEQYGKQISQLLRACFNDPELGLSAAQLEVVPLVARRQLLALKAASEEHAEELAGAAGGNGTSKRTKSRAKAGTKAS